MDFEKIKTRAHREWNALMKLPQPVIHVGMGTCGRAAGAEHVLSAVGQSVKRMGILCRTLQVGCIGMCYLEPLLAIRKPDRPFIYYGKVTPEMTEEILSSYLQHDDPKPQWATCTLGDKTVEGIPRFQDLPMIRPQASTCRACTACGAGSIGIGAVA